MNMNKVLCMFVTTVIKCLFTPLWHFQCKYDIVWDGLCQGVI